MGAVAGNVEVVPALAADLRLHRGEVRDAHHQAPAGPQPSRDPLQRRERVGDVLEHVPQRDGVQRPRRDLGLLDRGGVDGCADLAGPLEPPLRGLDPKRVIPRRAGRAARYRRGVPGR